LIIGQVIILFLSEIGWPSAFFHKFFPVLGDDFGLGALGVIQCLIGAAILSHHVNSFTLVSAFFLFSIGCLHMFVGLIFREKVKPRRSLTAWKERAKDVLPAPVVAPVQKVLQLSNTFGLNPTREMVDIKLKPDTTGGSNISRSTDPRIGPVFGRQGGLFLDRPVESTGPGDALPRYQTNSKPKDWVV